jgi:iron complex outermembrane receptor protein
MTMDRRSRRRIFASAALTATAIGTAVSAEAQDEVEPRIVEIDQIVVTGTRVRDRSATDTAVPVDVVSSDTLENVGVTEINQTLSVMLPSFNFPRPGLADGTDTIRPATLRGLSPDQTLVLLNSKRRHASSLVNVNGTIGRGAAAVDLNTVPSAIVQSIEVLRDGASAQYGSDAIAGVINLRLKQDSEGGDVMLAYGQRDFDYDAPVAAPPSGATWPAPSATGRDGTDGETLTLSGWKGLGFGEAGYVTLAAEYKDQKRTERDGYDFRQQYPLVGGAFDARETTIDRFNAWYGEPELEQTTLFANIGTELASGVEIYSWASYQDRESRSAGFFRRALDDRNVIQIYPDGFLPIITPEVQDYSAAGGATWEAADWQLDASLVYGKNEMQFGVENSLNRSMGTASPTRFDAGGFDYDQLVLNFSAVRAFAVDALASPLNLATGIEAREEAYSIFAGEPSSYINGGVLLPNGAPTASGAQVFPGFRPQNVTDVDRTAVGAYVDLEANLTEKFLGSAAVRAESYSDFGDNISGKIAARYDFTDSFALRGSMQTGFRAPSLQQQFFATTSTNFIAGIPYEITSFPVTDPVARALGAQDLDAEEAVNYSFGAVMTFAGVRLTIDAYRIDIDDRIVLSENLTQDNVRQYLESQGFIGIGGGRFFINGVDTETTGVDVVLTWAFDSDRAGQFNTTFVANRNNTDVTRVPATAPLAALNPPPPLFARVNVLTFEEGNPDSKFAATLNWSRGAFGATLRATLYGDALDPDPRLTGTAAEPIGAQDSVIGSQTLIDLEGRFEPTDRLSLAIGAENLLDEFPDPFPVSRNATGNTPFSNYAPFGRSGRYLYGRVSFGF